MRYTPKIDRFSSDLLIPGRTVDPRGFIVGDGVIEGLRGDIAPAVSIEAMRQAAQRYEQVGLVDRESFDQLADELEAAKAQVERLEAENERLEAIQERIAGLRRDGFTVQKIAGRPKASS